MLHFHTLLIDLLNLTWTCFSNLWFFWVLITVLATVNSWWTDAWVAKPHAGTESGQMHERSDNWHEETEDTDEQARAGDADNYQSDECQSVMHNAETDEHQYGALGNKTTLRSKTRTRNPTVEDLNKQLDGYPFKNTFLHMFEDSNDARTRAVNKLIHLNTTDTRTETDIEREIRTTYGSIGFEEVVVSSVDTCLEEAEYLKHAATGINDG